MITTVVGIPDGERIFIRDWPGRGSLPILFAPGLTSHHRAIAGVADLVDGAFEVIAFDLRGRGNSSKPESGYGMMQHGRDVLAVADALGIDRFVMSGHSMGAYVATAVAVQAPERVAGVVMIDGGVVPQFIADVPIDSDVLLEQVLGPSMRRLRTVYPSLDAFMAEQLKTPYFAGREDDPLVRGYITSDLARTDGGYRPKCLSEAARLDWADLLSEPVANRIERLKHPVLALAAEFGLTPDGPRVLGDKQRERLAECVTDLEWIDVRGVNHHTILISEDGARASAEAISEFVARLS